MKPFPIFTQTLTLPAKALLFGEYGLLQGLPGVAYVFWDHCFTLKFSVYEAALSETSVFQVNSSFFPSGSYTIYRSDLIKANASFQNNTHKPSAEWLFYTPLFPFLKDIKGLFIQMDVLKSFSPALGFGSSSALFSGMMRFFYSYFKNQSLLDNWQTVLSCLHGFQGKGSGYDVALQSQRFSEQKPTLYSIVFPDTHAPKIQPLPLLASASKAHWGAFLPTGQWSQTASALQQFQKFTGSEKKAFARRHADLAQDFLQRPCPSQLPSLFSRSRLIASQQGILPKNHNLQSSQVHWKSMGAGLGDCLWITPKEGQLPLYSNLKTAHSLFVCEKKTPWN